MNESAIGSRKAVDFRSDNVATISPEILRAIVAANTGSAAPYGADEHSRQLDERFSALFETIVKVFPVSTGTAANALSLSALTPPYGAVYCYEAAHIQTSEGGATEFFSGGAKLLLLQGSGFRFAAAALEQAIAVSGRGVRSRSQPSAVSVTQATEYGTVYRLDELRAIGSVARSGGLKFHMDGARFANALVALGCTPAEVTWRLGVDILSFGATKNGGMSADAIVVFDPSIVDDLAYRLRRAGQTWSKMRFAAAQLTAYVENDLFLVSARRANALASRIAEGVRNLPDAKLLAPVEANEVFLELPEAVIDRLIADAFLFYRRSPRLIRLVCRFDGSDDDADRFIVALRTHLARG
jgi:threonine aldolase